MLYRKYRPKVFSDVVGQDHITKTLQSEIEKGKLSHAYLFTGSRGTGKTTCARIFAKAINCEHSADGNPCLECQVCKDAENEALSDIIEIDAASNNGVDDIRDLREGAVYSPERCKYKVYIIDEVHMLSTNAFNALLKIIEEPPAYVKFILATTEVHKVLPTILSRCQRFDFRRIMPDDIAARLEYIAKEEKINLSHDAALLIARLADGGMRDALSLLDQCIAYSENIDLETVSAAAGIAGRDYLFDIIDAVVNGDTASALSVTDKLYSMSKDIARLCEELIFQFRNIMLIKSAPERKELLACLPSEQEKLASLASSLTLNDILSKLTILQECNERLSRSLAKRVEFEMCLVKLCSAQNMTVAPQPVVQSEQPQKVVPKEQPKAEPPAVKEQTQPTKAPENEPVRICKEWGDILEEFSKINPAVSSSLKDSRAFMNSTTIFILAKNPFFISLFKQEDNRASLSKAVFNILGKSYVIRAKVDKPDDAQEEKNSDAVKNLIGKANANGIPVGTE